MQGLLFVLFRITPIYRIEPIETGKHPSPKFHPHRLVAPLLQVQLPLFEVASQAAGMDKGRCWNPGRGEHENHVNPRQKPQQHPKKVDTQANKTYCRSIPHST